MSDLKSKQLAAELLQQTLSRKRSPGPLLLVLGVLYPASVITFELVTRWCAQSLFDPLPTLWHTLAVAAVPAGNLVLWLALRNHLALDAKWLMLLSGATIGIASFYALLFLPLTPIALFAVVFYGLGLLPLGPLASLVSAGRLARIAKVRYGDRAPSRRLAAGIAAGLALLLVLDIPAAATRVGVTWATSQDPAERQRGLSLLRTFGDEDLLLRLCYDTTGRPSGLLSALAMIASSNWLRDGPSLPATSITDVREVYYRVTGEPFNVRPAPFQSGSWTRFGDFQWDNDHGGTVVGGRIKGLDLVSSRIDGSISADDAVAYLEWIIELRNTSPLDREGRLQIALPPEGVVSRATLWVNGEEREAAYGGRGAVRAAYERVAVQQRRDPLLVTTKGADRVLAQAFPVPSNGGTIKFKLGITAPLDLGSDGKARLVLPAILDRNFSFAPDTPHQVWIEANSALTAIGSGLATAEVTSGLHRLAGALDDVRLAAPRTTIDVASSDMPAPRVAKGPDGTLVVQELVRSRRAAPGALTIVVDGSAKLSTKREAIAAALDTIPEGAKVGLTIAAEPAVTMPVAAWSVETRARAKALIRGHDFTGGEDNTPVLAKALADLEPHENAELLWIHGPQPIAFRASAGRLEQAARRLARLPALTLYAVGPGPNETLSDDVWSWGARTIPWGADVARDLGDHLAATLAPEPRPTIVRRAADTATDPAEAKGSPHIARLFARDQALALMRENGEASRGAAVALAAASQLVTPVTGAVVLETQQQFDEARLTPAAQASVPTVPEPHEWALILIAAASLIWQMRRQSRQGAHA